MSGSYSEYTANAIRAHLEEKGLPYGFDEENARFLISMPTPSRLRHTVLHIAIHEESAFTAYIPCPIVPDTKDDVTMREYMRLVHLINNEMKMGSCDMNPRTGDVSFRVYVSHEGAELSDQMISHAITAITVTLAKFSDALIGVILGWKTAAEMYSIASETGMTNIAKVIEAFNEAINESEDESENGAE